MFSYTAIFKNLRRWCFITAITQFIIFLLIFLVISYVSTFIKVKVSDNYEIVWISKYEKYIVLANSLFMIVPFAFSVALLFGLLQKHSKILEVYLWATLVNAGILVLTVIGSGIFLAVKGSPDVAYSLIAIGIILELFFAHSYLLTSAIKESFESASIKTETTPATLDDTDDIPAYHQE